MKNSLIHRVPQSGGHDTEVLRVKQSIVRLLLLLAVVLVIAPPAVEAAPSAQEILATARHSVAQQEINVAGQLRESTGRKIPFRLTQTGPVIRYSFTDPDEVLQLKLGEDDSKLEAISINGVDKIAGPEFDQKVRGTQITYEDLALKFIYWPSAKVLGEDYVNTRRVWKIELLSPGRQSQYSKVYVWCEQESGALMKMEGYDWTGRLTKRFEVISAQKLQGRWFLGSMRIDQLDPNTGKRIAYTYLEIKS